MGEIFKFIDFTFLENELILGICTHALPHSKLALSSCHHALAEGNYSYHQATFFRKSVSPNSRKGWRKLQFALSKLSPKI